MSIKYANMLQSFVLAVSIVFSIPISAYANGLVTEGQDEFGRRTETIQLPNGGTEVHTYDRETGVELFSKTYHGSSGKDDIFPKVKSESYVNQETGERTVITYNDPFDHSKGQTERKYIDSRVLGQIREKERAEQDRLRYEWELEQIKKGQFMTPKKPQPRTDEWDFLPDYEPGMILKDKKSDSDQNSSQTEEPVKDAMPLADPEPLTGDDRDSAPKVPDKGPDFSNFFGSFKEPEPKEIDYNKYGDQVVFDPGTVQTSVINSSTGAITNFRERRGGYFRNAGGGTLATTTLNGNVIHEDSYDRLGNLVSSTSIDPRTGIRTITDFYRDGTQTVRRTDAEGKPLLQKASTTDPDTGVTTTAQGNADGTRTVTKTDEDGNVIDQTTQGRIDSNVMIEGSTTDPKTGITRTGKKLKDGTTTITITDKSGKVIGTETRDASGKLMNQVSQAERSPSFGEFDAFRGSPMGQLAGASTPTAVLEGAQGGRNIAFGAGVMGGSSQSDSSPKAECEHS